MATKRSRGGALRIGALALACVVALAAGAALDQYLPGMDAGQGEAEASSLSLRISEVMTANASAVKSNLDSYDDWVEILNVGDAPVNLGGCVLRRDGEVAPVFTFPAQTLQPEEYLVVFCGGVERNTPGYALNAPFRLSAAGVSVELLDRNGAMVDQVQVPQLRENTVYRRDEAGAWEQSEDYTPGMANTRENHLLFGRERASSALVISEVMADNASYVPAADGHCYDYIEIYNPSDEAFDLSGAYLTDDEDDVFKWALPAGTRVEAGGTLLIYASGETGAAGELHAPFRLSSKGEEVLLSDAQGRLLAGVAFPALEADAAYSWVEGEYVTDFAPTPGLENTLSSARSIKAELDARNGTGVRISEIMASSSQTNYDWVEVENASQQAVDISGWGLSDDASRPRKWQFPQGTQLAPGEKLALFMAGFDARDELGTLYASFRLSAAGGYGLTLSDETGALLDRVFVPEQYTDVAYARMSDGVFLYTQQSTPQAQNATTGYDGRANKARLSVSGGLFQEGEALQIEISAAPGASIYYTLDGSAPDEDSTPYTGAIAVKETTIVRARVYQEGMLPSYIESQSYLYGADHAMRVVSLVIDPDDFVGDRGLYTRYDVEFEREGHVEVFDEAGTRMLSENCGLQLHGADSRKMDQKNFKVIARGEYGANRFNARLFSQRDYEQYQSFILRSSSEDGPKTRMRDSVLTTLAEGTGVFYQKTELCVVYINGIYWGHYNMRERINAASICQYEGWEGQEDNIDLVKGNSTVMRGSDQTYQDMLDLVERYGVPDDDALARVGEVIDLDNYIAYHALQIFLGNADTLNVKRYRNANADGKWRWVLYDLDWAFYVDTNSIARWLAPGGMGVGKRTDNTLFIELMKNPTFYDRFLTYIGKMMATQWTSQKILAKIMTRYEQLQPELERQFARWNQSQEEFSEEMNKLISYTMERPTKLIGYFRESLKLTDAQMERYFGEAIRVIQEGDAA